MERTTRTEPRHTLEQAPIESMDWQRYISQLDAIGTVGSNMLSELFAVSKAETVSPEDIDTALDTIDTTPLTDTQRALLDHIRREILRDQTDLLREIAAAPDEKEIIRKTLSTHINNIPEEIIARATMRPLLGSICITLHPYDYQQLTNQLGYPSEAIFIRSKQPNPSPIDTPLIVSTDTSIAVVEHEQMHVLMHRYIEPHELPIPESKDMTDSKDRIGQLSSRLASIIEEIDYADDVEETQSLTKERQQTERMIKKEKERLQTLSLERKTHTDSTSLRLYRDIRDELCAYLQEGRIQTKLARLIPPQRGNWDTRIEALPSVERTQFVAAWERVATYLTVLGADTPQLLPILISSPSLYILADRLSTMAAPSIAATEAYDASRIALLDEIDTYLDAHFFEAYAELCSRIPKIETLSEEEQQTLQDILRPKIALDWLASEIATDESRYPTDVVNGIALELHSSHLPTLLGQDEHIVAAVHVSPLHQILNSIQELHPEWHL